MGWKPDIMTQHIVIFPSIPFNVPGNQSWGDSELYEVTQVSCDRSKNHIYNSSLLSVFCRCQAMSQCLVYIKKSSLYNLKSYN